MYKLFLRCFVLSLCALGMITLEVSIANGPPAEPPSVALPPAVQGNEGEVPNGLEVTQGISEAIEEEHAQEAELERPALSQYRENSRFAYVQMDSRGEVADLLRSRFGDLLSALNQDPARFL